VSNRYSGNDYFMNEGLTLLIAIYLKIDNSPKTDNTILYVLFLSLLANGHKQDIQNRLRLTRDILNHNFGDTTLKQIKQNQLLLSVKWRHLFSCEVITRSIYGMETNIKSGNGWF
jgi:hypothetical protein